MLEAELEKSQMETLVANQSRYSVQAELDTLKSAAALVSQLQAQLCAAEARATHWQQVATQVLTPGSRRKVQGKGKEEDGGWGEERDGTGNVAEDGAGLRLSLLVGAPVPADDDPVGLFASTPSPTSKVAKDHIPHNEPVPVVDPAAKDAILQATLEENARLNAVVGSLQEEVKDSRAQLVASQASMQKEFASLWSAVQELNKLDAIKVRSIKANTCRPSVQLYAFASMIYTHTSIDAFIHSSFRKCADY